ncbi:MAG: hypothetical protein ACK5XN_19605, partial [Bacteroidota bacterium]
NAISALKPLAVVVALVDAGAGEAAPPPRRVLSPTGTADTFGATLSGATRSTLLPGTVVATITGAGVMTGALFIAGNMPFLTST